MNMADQKALGGASGRPVTEAWIHSRILRLQRTNPNIHIHYQNMHPRINVTNAPVRIRNVYAHVFELEYEQDGQKCIKILSYADVISRRIEIVELSEA